MCRIQLIPWQLLKIRSADYVRVQIIVVDVDDWKYFLSRGKQLPKCDTYLNYLGFLLKFLRLS